MTAPGGTDERLRETWPTLYDGQRAVLLEMLLRGSQPRVDLARTLGLSRASLTRAARTLVEHGLVEEGKILPTHTPGRPPEPLSIRPDSAHFLGINLTGHALHAVVTDLSCQVVATHERQLVSREVTDVVSVIAEVERDLLGNLRRRSGIGICLAGDTEVRDGRTMIVGSSFLHWEEPVPLGDHISRLTGLPTTITNDVEALTAAHHWFGAGVGCESLVVVAIGAGIGIGLVVNGEIVHGAHGRQGKIGHLPVDVQGTRKCLSGHSKCADAFVTMSGVATNAGLERHQYGLAVELAHQGDERAQAALRDAAASLGAIIAQFVNVFDPVKVIVTGEGIDMAELAREDLDRVVADRLDPRAAGVPEIDVQGFVFEHYAWGAAITALRKLLLSR